MNDNEIESIEWHKDQLARLLVDGDFGKVESELDFILEKAKSKKRIPVRRGGKVHYREQEVGREESEKKGIVTKPKKEEAGEKRRSEKNDYGISMNDISEGDYVDCGDYGKGPVTDKPTNEYITVGGKNGGYIHVSDVRSIEEPDEAEDDMYAPRKRNE